MNLPCSPFTVVRRDVFPRTIKNIHMKCICSIFNNQTDAISLRFEPPYRTSEPPNLTLLISWFKDQQIEGSYAQTWLRLLTLPWFYFRFHCLNRINYTSLVTRKASVSRTQSGIRAQHGC